MSYRKIIGDTGEELACHALEEKGYEILERNFRCRRGEVDIICEKNGEIVFTEVKTRTGNFYGSPAEAVTSEKQNRIRTAAENFIYSRGLERRNVSFQVIEVTVNIIDNAF